MKAQPAVRDVRERFVYPDDRTIEKPFDWRQMRRLMGYMAPYKRDVVVAVLVTMVGTVATLVVPLLISYAIDYGITPGDGARLRPRWPSISACAISLGG